ncbi:MAG: alkaline phosphatase D family protein [Betaproteobacteria bacterium]
MTQKSHNGIGHVLSRRAFILTAAALGAQAAWATTAITRVGRSTTVQSDLFPQGVASADPDTNSVLIWTRRKPPGHGADVPLIVEVAENPDFRHIVSRAKVIAEAVSDWTCRVLVGGLKANSIYWFRFVDHRGSSSRIGRTWTTPHHEDRRDVRFAFVCCQDVPLGYCTAYRHMAFEDEKRAPGDRIRFILHLGDFIYDEVWYPEERPKGFLGRKLRDIVRFPDGAFIDNTHVPVSTADYRALYRAYLDDPDLQDARARWPFVCVWDNHEFSSPAWQTASDYAPPGSGAQARKVAAAQAWFEYVPARVIKGAPNSARTPLSRFSAPAVKNAPLTDFDKFGFSHEPNNVAALECLTIYRSLRCGQNVKLVITDNRTYRSEPAAFAMDDDMGSPAALFFTPAELINTYDAGRNDPGGAPQKISFNGKSYSNKRSEIPTGSMLGKPQKDWFFAEIARPQTMWTFWGNSVGALERRSDLHNLPPDLRQFWLGRGYGIAGNEDWGGYPYERAEILNFLHMNRVTNFVSLAGDRHQFFAGVLSANLPPEKFEPVAVEFGVSSISTPTLFEAADYITRNAKSLRPLYAHDSGGDSAPAINMTLKHGVRSSIILNKTGNLNLAIEASNPEVAPHLTFTDSANHGYIVIKASSDDLLVDLVAFSKPVAASAHPYGDQPEYRVAFRVPAWAPNAAPHVELHSTEGRVPIGSI